MKKLFIISFLLCIKICSYAQEATTVWPYMYSDFKTGVVYFKAGQKAEIPVNIHLLESKLHYIDGDKIKEVDSDNVILLDVDNVKFYSFNGQMMRVVAEDENSFIAELVLTDMAAMREAGGAYGSSSTTQANMQLSSIAGSNADSYMLLKQGKIDGKILILEKKYYIISNGEIFPATKKGIESQLSSDRQSEFKAFLKKEKIKWRDEGSIAKLLRFF